MKNTIQYLWCIPLLFGSLLAQAQYGSLSEDKPFPKVEPMQWINNNYLEIQRKHIDELARDNFAKRFKGTKADLSLLQRFADRKVIDRDDKKSLQALGVILGDIFVSEYAPLEWAVFEDELGKSHAVCVKETTECLFVTTMLSRRMEVGSVPDIRKIYKNNYENIKQFFPKRAYNPY